MMANLHYVILCCVGLLVGGLPTAVRGAPPLREEADLARVRRIYVPWEHLEAALREDRPGAVLSRTEFEQLLTQARGVKPRQPASVTSAVYDARLDGQRLLADVEVSVETFAAGDAVALHCTGWNVEAGRVGDQPASLTRADGNTLRLLVPQPGVHRVQLQLSCPIRAAGSDLLASAGLIGAGTERFRISLPKGKSLLLNGALMPPGEGEQPNVQFDLPVGGLAALELVITDRRSDSQGELLTFASTAYGLNAVPGELTWSAKTQLHVFGRSLDRVQCRVPRQLELTSVESEGLEAWELSDDPAHPGQTTVKLQYRQSIQGERAIQMRGLVAAAAGQPWTAPPLIIADVTAHSGVILIQHPDALRLNIVEASGVRPLAAAGPDRGALAHVELEAWREEFTLRFLTAQKTEQLQVAVTNLLQASSEGLQLSVTGTLQTRFAPVFEARLRMPAVYRPLAARMDGEAREWELTSAEAGVNEVRVPLLPPLLPGQTRTVTLSAQFQPEVWPPQQTPVQVELPEVRWPQAALVESRYGLIAPPEWDLTPLDMVGLEPASQAELDALNSKLNRHARARLGFVAQDTAYRGQLAFARRPAELSVRTLEYFRIERETVRTRLEARLAAGGGGLRDLTLRMSEAAGSELRFALSSVDPGSPSPQIVEQIPGPLAEGLRTWTLKFDRPLLGTALLTTEAQAPRGAAQTFSPPRWTFPQAQAQSVFLAVEGDDDELLRITSRGADGQPLPVVDPADFPHSAQPAEGRIVAAFRDVYGGWTLEVAPVRFDRAPVPSAIGHRLDMETLWDDGQAACQQARLTFTASGMQGLLVQLPDAAELWSVLLDQQPAEARRRPDGIQIPLPGAPADQPRQLQLVYGPSASPKHAEPALRLSPPAVSVLTGAGQPQPLEILQQSWRLHVPEGVLVGNSRGTFRPDRPLSGDAWLSRLRDLVRIPNAGHARNSALILAIAAALLWLLHLTWSAAAARGRWGALLAAVALGVILLLTSNVLFVSAPEYSGRADRESATGSVWNEYPGSALAVNDALSRGEAGVKMPADKPSGAAGLQSHTLRDTHDYSKSLAEKTRPNANAVQAGRAATVPPPQSPPAPAAAAAAPSSQPFGSADPRGLAAKGDDAVRQRSQAAAAPDHAGVPARGLLSMTVSLQAPQRFSTETFLYRGGALDAALDVQLAPRSEGRLLAGALALGVLLIGWGLRRTGGTAGLWWGLAALTLGAASVGLVPLAWRLPALGVACGGFAALGLRLVRVVVNWSAHRWQASRWQRLLSQAALLAIACMVSLDPAQADEPAPPVDPYVVIPYASPRDLSTANRVWVPASLYRQLWQATHPEELQTPAAPAATVAEARYAARLEADAAGPRIVVQARWVVVSHAAQPLAAMLPIAGAALSGGQVDGQPATFLASENKAPSVIVAGRGPHVVDAQLALPAEVNGPVGRFSIECLPVGAGTLSFTAPAAAAPWRFRVNGTSDAFRRLQAGRETQIVIPVDRGGAIDVGWQPEQQQGDAAALVQMDEDIAVRLTPFGLEVRQSFSARVRQGAISELQLEIPEGLALQQVSGPDVAGWELAGDADQKRLKVSLRRSVSETTQIQTEAFQRQPLGDAAQTLKVLSLAPRGVAREIGQVGIFTDDRWRLRPTELQNATQIDPQQFRQTGASAAPQLAFRFAARPLGLTIEAAPRTPDLRATAEHGVDVGLRQVRLASRLQAALSGPAQRSVEVELPQGYQLLDVVCPQASDWSQAGTAQQPRLHIELSEPRTGNLEIGLEGRLLRPPGAPEVAVALPRLAGASRESAMLGVWFDESEAPALAKAGNWRAIPSSQAPLTILKLQSRPPQFAFRCDGPPAGLGFQTTRSAPQLSADVAALIAVGDATIDYGLTLRWTLASGAVDQFTFLAPTWLGRLDVAGPGIRQTLSEDAGGGQTRWTIQLIDPARQGCLLTAAATIAAPADHTVRTPRVELETLGPQGQRSPLETQRQFAVLVNLSQQLLAPVAAGQLEPVAVEQLPLNLPPDLVRQAMAIVRVRPDRLPAWTLQRSGADAGARAVIVSAQLTTVLEMDGSWRTRAVYAVRNRGQQLLAVQLPGDARLLSVFVRGAPSRALASTVNQTPVQLIPLPQTSAADLSFEVSLLTAGRLDHPLPDRPLLSPREIRIPAPQTVSPQASAEFGVPTAQTSWTVYVPEELDAAPADKADLTNVSWERTPRELSAEWQFLERLRSDVEELSRLSSDRQASAVRRHQARENLRQLQVELKLQESRLGDSSLDLAAPSFRYSNHELQAEAAQAVNQAFDMDLDAVQNMPAETGNRAFIISNNSFLSASNSLPALQQQAEQPAAGFNFYAAQDARRQAIPAARGVDLQARSRLKEELAKQAPVAEPAPANGHYLGFGRRNLATEFESAQRKSGLGGMPAGMGGGMGGALGVQKDKSGLGLDGLLADAQTAGPASGAQPSAPAPQAWARTGGLSLAMELPASGQALSFSKAGGEPQLTLSVGSKRTWSLALGVGWALACAAAAMLLARLIRSGGATTFIAAFARLGLLLGALGFLAGAETLRWPGLGLFCLSGIILAALPLLRAAPRC